MNAAVGGQRQQWLLKKETDVGYYLLCST
jgi:hypothetical protein